MKDESVLNISVAVARAWFWRRFFGRINVADKPAATRGSIVLLRLSATKCPERNPERHKRVKRQNFWRVSALWSPAAAAGNTGASPPERTGHNSTFISQKLTLRVATKPSSSTSSPSDRSASSWHADQTHTEAPPPSHFYLQPLPPGVQRYSEAEFSWRKAEKEEEEKKEKRVYVRTKSTKTRNLRNGSMNHITLPLKRFLSTPPDIPTQRARIQAHAAKPKITVCVNKSILKLHYINL